MYEDFRRAIAEATGEDRKVAMFHYIVLKNAKELEGENPKQFCKLVDVTEAYATEFRKMLKLSQIIQEKGF